MLFKNEKQFRSALTQKQSTLISGALVLLKQDKRVTLTSPTGTGKTEMGFGLIKAYGATSVLWLSHTRDLKEQSKSRALAQGLDIDSLTIQKLSRPESKIPKKKYDLIIVDEAHHAASASYRKVLEKLKHIPQVGLTATPHRPDSLPLNLGEIDGMSLSDAIDSGFWAVPLEESFVSLTPTTLKAQADKDGKFSERSLERLWVSPERNKIILKKYVEARKILRENNLTPKTIVYCINIKHAERMAKLFHKKGFSSNFICGNLAHTKKKERVQILKDFTETNKIEVLCAVDLLNEGVNIPDVTCVMMARPTSSNIIYQQQIGRATRIIPGIKTRFLIVDFVDNTDGDFVAYHQGNLELRVNGVVHKPKVDVTEVRGFLSEEVIQRTVNAVEKLKSFEAVFNQRHTVESLHEEAKKYKRPIEMKQSNGGAYQSATRRGLLPEFRKLYWLKTPKGK